MIQSNILTKISEELHTQHQRLIVSTQFELFAEGVVFECVYAKLYQNYITIEFQNSEGNQINIIKFSFNLCFNMVRPYMGTTEGIDKNEKSKWHISQCYLIRFDKGDQYIELRYPKKESDLEIWRNHLKTKLNQRGFHEQFTPIKKLGVGKFAQVFQVKSCQEQKLYAAKSFSKSKLQQQKNGFESLINEIEVLRMFNHKNLMKLDGVYETQNSLYLVIQLLNAPLFSVIKFAQLEDRRKIIKDIIQGLVEMHSKGIMHRDLKPENIILRSKTSSYVLADFGLAQNVNDKKFLFVQCGTYGYVAPQILNLKNAEERYDEKCDIFSAGMILYALMFKRTAFKNAKNSQLLMKNKECNIEFKETQKRKFWETQLDLLQKMIEKDPKKRLSAEQILNHEYFHSEPKIHHHVHDINEEIVLTAKENELQVKPKEKKKPKVVKKSKRNQQNEPVVNDIDPKVREILESKGANMSFKKGECMKPVQQDERDFEGINSPQALKLAARQNFVKSQFERSQSQWNHS